MLQKVTMPSQLEIQAQEAALEIISRTAVRKVITAKFKKDAIDTLMITDPKDKEAREDVHKLMHAMEEFFGRLENLATEAQMRREAKNDGYRT